jgi:hypothetical protein
MCVCVCVFWKAYSSKSRLEIKVELRHAKVGGGGGGLLHEFHILQFQNISRTNCNILIRLPLRS